MQVNSNYNSSNNAKINPFKLDLSSALQMKQIVSATAPDAKANPVGGSAGDSSQQSSSNRATKIKIKKLKVKKNGTE